MNLIEQLGGYEAAKGLFNLYEYSISFKYYKVFKGDFESAGYIDVFIPDLQKALLEYRRQHSIFEVGDKVIKTHPKNTILWPVLGVYKNGGVWLDYKGFCWKPPRVRHATDAEIKAGKRLEVNQ